jgi:signal peptidase I
MEEKQEILAIFKNLFKILYELIKIVCFTLAIFFLVRYLLIQPFIVDGNSMEPNFHHNEYLLIEKISYRFRDPQRGDVIIFQPPNKKIYYIKRIIGLPGEKIVLNGGVKIYNKQHPEGITLNEPYLKPYSVTNGEISLTLKSDEYFVLGDNRENSSDSREFGALPRKNIAGKVFITIFPFSNFGLTHRLSYPELSLLPVPLYQ